MAITDNKITTGEVNSNHVKNAPNVLTGTAQTNKNYFDKLPELIVSKHNDLIDDIDTGKQDTLVSGTNIKTVNSTSLLGSGNVSVQPTLVSGTNIKTVNSTSLLGSGNVAVQPTLVSGTNIKTINNNSILGSGNVAVQPTLVSGTNIKTINNNSILGSGNLTVDYPDYTYATDSANGVHGLVPAPLKPYNPDDRLQVLTAKHGWQSATLDATIGGAGPNAGKVLVNLHMRDNGSSTDSIYEYAKLPDATTTSSGTMSAADKTKLNNAQEALVSGTNIKTINNNSLLGSGNITLGVGSGNAIGIYKSHATVQYFQSGDVPTYTWFNFDHLSIRDSTVSDLLDIDGEPPILKALMKVKYSSQNTNYTLYDIPIINTYSSAKTGPGGSSYVAYNIEFDEDATNNLKENIKTEYDFPAGGERTYSFDLHIMYISTASE